MEGLQIAAELYSVPGVSSKRLRFALWGVIRFDIFSLQLAYPSLVELIAVVGVIFEVFESVLCFFSPFFFLWSCCQPHGSPQQFQATCIAPLCNHRMLKYRRFRGLLVSVAAYEGRCTEHSHLSALWRWAVQCKLRWRSARALLSCRGPSASTNSLMSYDYAPPKERPRRRSSSEDHSRCLRGFTQDCFSCRCP